MLFFTSDLHFNHANVIAYCSRPFKDVDEMNATLIANWNETVAPSDTVWLLGDVCLGDIKQSLGLVANLHGTKHLVVGNHDRPFRTEGIKTEGIKTEWEQRYLDAGFASLHHGSVDLEHTGLDAVMSHFPFTGDSQSSERFTTHRPIDTGRVLLHGHVHGRWRRKDRLIDVGVDAWAGRPVSVETIIAELAGPKYSDPLPWP
jgi:calcineurin-like phosphoesterase family protein